jgi:integrase
MATIRASIDGRAECRRPNAFSRACCERVTIGLIDHRPEEDMIESQLLDRTGRRRSPATFASFHQGQTPCNKGLRYPPDPPSVNEIIAVIRTAGDRPEGLRLRGLIVVLWRAGLRISEASALAESDLDRGCGAVLVRHGQCRIRHWPCYAGAPVMPNGRPMSM